MAPASQQMSSKCFEMQTADRSADLGRRIKEAADKWSFVAQTLGLKWRTGAASNLYV
jgi:hypothetical protein